MRFTKTAVSAAAFLAVAQPALGAPLVSAIIGGVIALIGGITDVAIHAAHPDARDLVPIEKRAAATVQPGIQNQLAWQECVDQLAAPGTSVSFTFPATGTLLTAGVPSACMTLSGVLTGTYNEGDPVPMGTDSIQFTNLTPDDVSQIQEALSSHPSKTRKQ